METTLYSKYSPVSRPTAIRLLADPLLTFKYIKHTPQQHRHPLIKKPQICPVYWSEVYGVGGSVHQMSRAKQKWSTSDHFSLSCLLFKTSQTGRVGFNEHGVSCWLQEFLEFEIHKVCPVCSSLLQSSGYWLQIRGPKNRHRGASPGRIKERARKHIQKSAGRQAGQSERLGTGQELWRKVEPLIAAQTEGVGSNREIRSDSGLDTDSDTGFRLYWQAG